MGGHAILIGICFFFLSGCASLPFDYPKVGVKVETLKREDAALRVSVENKSSLYVKITYPIETTMLEPDQYTIFSLSKPGNYNIVFAGYEENKDYKYDYKKIKTIEVPVFLNGHDIIKARGELVGYSLVITDGMFSLKE